MSTANPSAAVPRHVGLDLLRLTAVVLVLFNHATYSSELFPPPVAGVLEALRRGGWVGVDLFFVLSGFLVSGLLFSDHQRNGRASIGNFLIRRGLKIYPAFWVLLAYTLFSIFRRKVSFAPSDLWGEILFLQNYLGQLWGHTWSLAVEEHFYLGFALTIFLLQRRGDSSPFSPIPAIFVVVATVCLAFRALEAWRNPTFEWHAHMTPTHFRADSLFFGVLLSYYVRYRGLLTTLQPITPWLRIVIGAGLLLPAFLLDRNDHRWLTVVGYNLFYLGSGLLLLGVIEWNSGSSKLVRLLASLGAASYSMYLWHAPCNIWTSRLTRHESALQDSLYLGAFVASSMIGGLIMARLVEIPVLRYRDRTFKSRSASLPASDPHSGSPSFNSRSAEAQGQNR